MGGKPDPSPSAWWYSARNAARPSMKLDGVHKLFVFEAPSCMLMRTATELCALPPFHV
jgi:hypothetical protein